jgi:predicted nucleotidyltransferase
VFGSAARSEARADSDIDVLVELDPNKPMGIFEYSRLKIFVNEILNGAGDVVNRRTLKPLLRDNILRDAVHAFRGTPSQTLLIQVFTRRVFLQLARVCSPVGEPAV